MIATSLADSFIKEPKLKKYIKKTPETMSDAEIRNKLCLKVHGGCKFCDMLEYCKYGQQCIIRKLQQ